MAKEISEATALQARGLFELGRQHYKILREAERALHRLLEHKDENDAYCGCLSDELYDEDRGNFDRGLKSEGYIVMVPKPPTKRRR